VHELRPGGASGPFPARSQSMLSLRADGLTLGYGRRPPVLEDISFDSSPGVTLLLGANGAGKSTLIAALARTHRLRQGTCHLIADGVELGDRDTRLHTGLLPQAPAFSSRMTGSQCVAYVAWLRRVPRAVRATNVRTALEIANATHVIDVPWSRMSYGTKQRVAIAAALVNRPSLLLLDEPLNGLDIGEKHSLIGVLGSLPWPAVSVVSSHVVEGLEEIATNVVVLTGGRVAYAGSSVGFLGVHGSMERAYLALQKV
jgi:ABC-2 type transport system ATP-binding protein